MLKCPPRFLPALTTIVVPVSLQLIRFNSTTTSSSTWKTNIRDMILKERERSQIQDLIPEKSEVHDGTEGEKEEEEKIRITSDISPSFREQLIDEAIEERVKKGERDWEPSADPIFDSHEDAHLAFEERKRVTDALREQRAERRERKARWLMWQASQREKGFEQRVRKQINSQAGRQRLHYSTVGSRYMATGRANEFADALREIQENENEKKINNNAIKNINKKIEEQAGSEKNAFQELEQEQRREREDQKDEDFDDMIGLQDPRWEVLKNENFRRHEAAGFAGGNISEASTKMSWYDQYGCSKRK